MNDDQFPGSALDGGAEEPNEGAEAAAEARQREPAASDGEFVLGSLNSVSGQAAPVAESNSCYKADTRAERSKSRKAVAQANFAAGIDAWRSQASPAVGEPAPTPKIEPEQSDDPNVAALLVGATTDAIAEDATPGHQSESSLGSSTSSWTPSRADAGDVQAGELISSESSHPGLVVLVSDRVVEGAFEHSDGVVTTRANIAELDDSLLELAAPLLRDVVAAVLGAESARVGLERQTKIYLESGRVGRQWVMRVDSEFAARLGDASTVGYLTQFFGYVVDREIWSPKMDSIVAVGGIEARLIAVARALRQAKVGGRQLGSAARLLCTAWRSPIEFPRNIGESRPPQRDTQDDEAVGHVTCDDWGDRVLSVRPFRKKAKVYVSYVKAEGQSDQADIVKEAHGNRTQIYRAEFKATIVDGRVEHRSLTSLTPVQPDLYPNTKDQ
jgi:hypothetical protein